MKQRTYSIIAIDRGNPSNIYGITWSKGGWGQGPQLHFNGNVVFAALLEDKKYGSKKATFRHWDNMLRIVRRAYPEFEFMTIRNGHNEPIVIDWKEYWSNDKYGTIEQKRRELNSNNGVIVPFKINYERIGEATEGEQASEHL